MRFFLWHAALAASVAFALSCGESTTESTFMYPDADVTVFVFDNYFSPSTIEVPANGTVLFRWAGSNEHNTVFIEDNAPVDCPYLTVGYCLRQFPEAGTFGFYCTPHAGAGMTGAVTVTAAP